MFSDILASLYIHTFCHDSTQGGGLEGADILSFQMGHLSVLLSEALSL